MSELKNKAKTFMEWQKGIKKELAFISDKWLRREVSDEEEERDEEGWLYE